MKVSGFTFLRNAHINGYPFVESIKSLLPIVDEMICVIGQGDDATKETVMSIGDAKIRIIDSMWNESMRDRGFVYGQQKMIAQYNCSGDWAVYLEADEILHEDDLDTIQTTMKANLDDLEVEALYFDFLHFYGIPSQIGIAGYRKAPRIIRNSIRSIAPDGLFWIILEKNKKGRYPKAKYAGAKIYHYGHCRKIEKMSNKLKQVGKYWSSEHDTFSTYGRIDPAELRPFRGSHPQVIAEWLKNEAEQVFELDPTFKLTMRNFRNRLRFWIEEKYGVEISKKHFHDLG